MSSNKMAKNIFQILSNERGNALLLTLVASIGMLFATFAVNKASTQTDLELRKNRLRNELLLAQARLSAFLTHTSSLASNRVIDLNLITTSYNPPLVHQVIPPSDTSTECPTDSTPNATDNPGVSNTPRVESWICLKVTVNDSENGITGRLHMISGADDITLQPIDIRFTRDNVLHGDTILSCPDAGGIGVITGLDSQNQVICSTLEGNFSCADSPQAPYAFLKGRINNGDSFSYTCGAISPALDTLGCAANQYIADVFWSGDDNFSAECKTMQDPFAVWPPVSN